MLSENHRNILVANGVVRRYRHPHLLFERTDEATRLFIVLGGQVEVFVETGRGRTMIARKESGEMIGEVELLGGQRRLASAATVESSLLAAIEKPAFEECLNIHPELCAAVLRDLAVAMGDMTMRLSTLPLSAYGRLRHCLSSLARSTGDGAVVEGSWTQQQLAEVSGCRRETVAKIMSELRRGQWIRLDKRRITILRPLPQDF